CSVAVVPSLFAADGVVAPDSDAALDPMYDAVVGADGAVVDAGDGQFPGAASVRALFKDAQDKVLGPCLRNSDSCRRGAADLLARMKGQGATVERWAADWEPVRNNMYFYLIAPSLRLAKAIVGTQGGCGEWRGMARGCGMALHGHLRKGD